MSYVIRVAGVSLLAGYDQVPARGNHIRFRGITYVVVLVEWVYRDDGQPMATEVHVEPAPP